MLQILFYLLSFFLSLGQAGRISFFNQQINIYPFEIVLVVIIFILFSKRHFSLLLKSACLLNGILFISLVNGFWEYNLLQNLVGIAYLIRFSLYILFLLLLLTSSNEIKKMATKSFWVLVILIPFFSIVQYFLYPDLRNLYYLGWDPHLSRVFGSFFDSTVTGTILVLLFFWNIVNIQKKRISIHIILPVVIFILILLTYSRITYIEFIVGIILLLYSRIGLLKTVGLIGLFAAVLFLLPRPFGESVKLERIFTIESRVTDYKEGFKLFSKKPILGYGFDRLKYARGVEISSHAGNYSSSFLTILVSSGIVGMGAFIYFLFRLYFFIPKEMRLFLVIVLVGSLFDNLFLNNFVLLILFWIFGQNLVTDPSDR